MLGGISGNWPICSNAETGAVEQMGGLDRIEWIGIGRAIGL
jgi:hypothetical protein